MTPANTNTPTPLGWTDEAQGDDLVGRLLKAADASSVIQRGMAETKSLRQPDNLEGRTDLYMFVKPEKTLEGRAAARIQALEAALVGMRSALEQVRLIVEDEAYKITAGQPLCKHIAALNEIHETAEAALSPTGNQS